MQSAILLVDEHACILLPTCSGHTHMQKDCTAYICIHVCTTQMDAP